MKQKYSSPLLCAVLLNFILFMVKFYIGLRTNSLCIYTDSINNLLDAFAVAVAFIGSLFLDKPPTKTHPFGFGRVEYILEFIMSVLISLTGFAFAYNSLQRLMMPTPVWFYVKYAYVLLGSCIVKLLLGGAFLILERKQPSDVLKAVRIDSFLDAAITTATLISFTLSNLCGVVLDGFLGLAISICITISGVRLICSSVSKLIGKEDEICKKQISDMLTAHFPEITLLDILIHDYGTKTKYAVLKLSVQDCPKRAAFQKEIQAKVLQQTSIKINIEWEDLSCLTK